MFLTANAAKIANPETKAARAMVPTAATGPYVDLAETGNTDGQADNDE